MPVISRLWYCFYQPTFASTMHISAKNAHACRYESPLTANVFATPPGSIGSTNLCSMPTDLIQEIAADEVIDLTYDWLCRRRDYSHHDDV